MSTSGYGGKTLSKKVTVKTNDLNNSQIPLRIKGRVIALYSLNPKSVKLKGVIGETIRETVRLVPNKAYAFRVQEITAKRGENIRFQYKEINNGGNAEYEVTVENIATKTGVYFDTLYLKTDSEKKEKIEISVIGSIQKATDPTEKKEGG